MKKQIKRQLRSITRKTEKAMNLYLKSEEFKSNPDKYIHVLATMELHFRAFWLQMQDLSEKGRVAPKATVILKFKKPNNHPAVLGLLTLEKVPTGAKIKRISLSNQYETAHIRTEKTELS